MTLFEPTRAWQDSLHLRILQKDVTAFAELCELALPHLVEFLQQGFPNYDSHLHETVAIDCLLTYQTKASQYDIQRISLYAYLRMAARRDMLNAIDKASRMKRRVKNIDDPDVRSLLAAREVAANHSDMDEWLLEHTNLSLSQIIKMLDRVLDEQEKRILTLMLEGVRDSDQYAIVLGVTDLDTTSQQMEVKRAKDRLIKKLRRFGQRIKKAE